MSLIKELKRASEADVHDGFSDKYCKTQAGEELLISIEKVNNLLYSRFGISLKGMW